MRQRSLLLKPHCQMTSDLSLSSVVLRLVPINPFAARFHCSMFVFGTDAKAARKAAIFEMEEEEEDGEEEEEEDDDEEEEEEEEEEE